MSWRQSMIDLARTAKPLCERKAKTAKTGRRRGPNTLSDEVVALIKRDLRTMTLMHVALTHNVPPTTVGRIKREECYVDVKAAPDA